MQGSKRCSVLWNSPSNLSAWRASTKSFATENFSVKDERFGKILMPLSTCCDFAPGTGNAYENREKDSICLWKQDKESDTTATVRNRKSLCYRKLRPKSVMSTYICVESDSCQVRNAVFHYNLMLKDRKNWGEIQWGEFFWYHGNSISAIIGQWSEKSFHSLSFPILKDFTVHFFVYMQSLKYLRSG